MNKLLDFVTDPLFLALIVFIVLLVGFNTIRKMGRGKAWKQLAAETGLQFSRHETANYHDQQLSGLYRKRQITLTESVSADTNARRREHQREGNRSDTSTDIRFHVNVPESVKLKLNRIITIGEVTLVTGDPEIDRHFNISSEPDWLTGKILSAAGIRQKLPGLKMGGAIYLQEGELLFSQDGRISDASYLKFLFDFLSDLADSVEQSSFE
jgi:hypothetical protein